MNKEKQHKVLIVTGSLVSARDRSVWNVLRKQLAQRRVARHAWLESKIKTVAAEPLVASMFENKRQHVHIADFFAAEALNSQTPELTEVVLAGLLQSENMAYEVATYNDLFERPRQIALQLKSCDVVFASSTLLHDLSELTPLIKQLKRKHNRIVVGGALAGDLWKHWQGMQEVDVLAVGYGELLVKSLCHWIRNDFNELAPPPGGRLTTTSKQTMILHSGVPESTSLDFLPRPDWELSMQIHNRKFKMINYESVRGCPYRCSFCNYPYLFDDKKFRYLSAERMANDWEHYAKTLGVSYITCLDSLFTMPKRRLIEFCKLLIEKQVDIKWICYARADDLIEESTVALMKQAGALQVQIGIESGNENVLDNMNKRCTIDSNKQAIANCRKYGITTLVSVIVGYPGETANTVEDTFKLLREARPDFHFIATFSTRVQAVPVLSDENRDRFALWTMPNDYTMAPYWEHETMSCADVGNWVRYLSKKLMHEKISLDASMFYTNILSYQPIQRDALLSYQYNAITQHKWIYKIFDWFNLWLDKKLINDLDKCRPIYNNLQINNLTITPTQ